MVKRALAFLQQYKVLLDQLEQRAEDEYEEYHFA
jgi:hypothetical protein